MFEKIKSVEQKYEEIAKELENPDTVRDQARFTQLMREHKKLTPVVEKYREYAAAVNDEQEAREILAGSADKELKELAQEQLDDAVQRVEATAEELKVLLLPQDPNDHKNVIIEIRGGAGGEEAALFAGALTRMYSMYAETKRWKIEMINANETELGGYKEVSFMIEGEGAYSRFKYESGVHRVQRVPETEASGRIHTSTVTVAVLPQVEDVEVDINPADLQIDTYRSGGAGGQHVNKTESAIRITHIPTGLVVECQDERSQHKNRDKAMKVLKSRLYEQELNRQQQEIASDRKAQVGTGDRSERIRTYNYPQGRMTDHRIGLTLYRLEQILNGDIDEIVDALITHYRAQMLKGEDENANI